MRDKSHPVPSLDIEADLREETDGTNVKQRPGDTDIAECEGWVVFVDVGTATQLQGHAGSWRRFVKI